MKRVLVCLPAALLATGVVCGQAWASSCTASVGSTCTDASSCTVITGTYTNNTGAKLKQASIVAASSDDGKTVAAALVVFTGTSVTAYDPSSNTPPSGLAPGETATYTITTAFPLAAMDSGLTCAVENVW